MGDVPQGRVRVSPARLKKLKKAISGCDHHIQQLDTVIDQANVNIAIGHHLDLIGTPEWKRWIQIRDNALAQRKKLDESRKIARLEVKGYR